MKTYTVLYYYRSFKFLPAKIKVLQYKTAAENADIAVYKFNCFMAVYLRDIEVITAIEISK